MSNLFGDDDGLFDLAEVAGSLEDSEVQEFEAWHKPRKQFVRCKQWWYHLDFLLKRYEEYKSVETIKYFGLPGSDLLDVSYFSKQLLSSQEHSNKILFVHGFIDSVQGKQKADLRLSELLDRKNVHASSKVDNFNFHALAENNTLALERVRHNGAYHLINLDFCDGVFKRRTISSMMALLTYQFNNMSGIPWLFFLTTRADMDGIANDLMDDLDRIFKESLKGDEAFVLAVQHHSERIHKLIIEQNSLRNQQITRAELSELLQACFLFWAISLMHANETRMEVVSTMKYKVHEGNNFPDMFSYVVRVTKNIIVKPDPLNLGQAVGLKPGEVTNAEKCQDKKQAAKKLHESLDIDDYLSTNPEELKHFTNEMKMLLKEAGWNVDKYEQQMGV